MSSTTLSVTRAMDRQKMAQELQAVIAVYCATCTRIEGEQAVGPRAIRLKVEAPRGLRVTVDLDGDSCQPDVHVLSWHMAPSATAQLNDATFGGNVNPYHKQKATYVAHGFLDLIAQLRKGLAMAVDGSAFLAE